MSLLLLIFITLFYYKWSIYVDFKVIFKSFLLVTFPEVTILVKGRNKVGVIFLVLLRTSEIGLHPFPIHYNCGV